MKPNILTLSSVNDNLFWYSKHHPILVGDTTVQLSSHGIDGIKIILGEHINIDPEYITRLTVLEYLTTLHVLLETHKLHTPHVNNIVFEIYRKFGDNPPIDNVIYYYINRITISVRNPTQRGNNNMAWAEDYFDDYALEIHLAEEALREKVDKLTDSEFVSMIIEETKPDIMNNVVRGNRFPAYKVADSCLESGHITPKQRRAITNVYVHAYA